MHRTLDRWRIPAVNAELVVLELIRHRDSEGTTGLRRRWTHPLYQRQSADLTNDGMDDTTILAIEGVRWPARSFTGGLGREDSGSTPRPMVPMPQPGDRYAKAFTVEQGQCWAMVHDAKGQATHSAGAPSWTGR